MNFCSVTRLLRWSVYTCKVSDFRAQTPFCLIFTIAMPPKKRPKIINVREKEKLKKMFEEASEDSSEAQSSVEESEFSADEREGSVSDEEGTDVSAHDPYSDGGGEYGSDGDYQPSTDEDTSEDTDSDSDARNRKSSGKFYSFESATRSEIELHDPLVSYSHPQDQSLQPGDCFPSLSHDDSTLLPPQYAIASSLPQDEPVPQPQHDKPVPLAQNDETDPPPQHDKPHLSLQHEPVHVPQHNKPVHSPPQDEPIPSPPQVDPAPPMPQDEPAPPSSQPPQNDPAFPPPQDKPAPPSPQPPQDDPASTPPRDEPAPPPPLDEPAPPPPLDEPAPPLPQDEPALSPPLDEPGPPPPQDEPAPSPPQNEPAPPPPQDEPTPRPPQDEFVHSSQHDHPPESSRPRGRHRGVARPRIPSPVWEDSVAPIDDFPFDASNCGPTVSLNNTTTPLDVLELFITPQLINYIITCTNAYGAALSNSNRPHTRGSRKQTFKSTDSTEIRKFLGLCLLQGHVDAPHIRKLFTYTDPLYYHPVFPLTMSGRRFEQLLRCLYFSELNSKGMDKIQLFATKVLANFQKLYRPDKQLSLDESLLAYRGRLSFRTYMKNKKKKYGIKFYVLTAHDSYVLNFVIYGGKSAISPNESKLEKLVMSLMGPYLHKGHELYMDNFYNSVPLSNKLLACETHTTGTLRKDRKGNPKNLFKKNLHKGEHFWQRSNKVYASLWKDKRVVYMITTNQHPRLVTTRNRFGTPKIKPIEVREYNRYMSGIDRADQMLSYYSTPKKTVRWYKKVFFHLFDMAISNAFYLYVKYCDPKATLLSFREAIINSYLGLNDITNAELSKIMPLMSKKNSSRRTKSSMNAAAASARSDETNHWPELIPVGENAKRNKAFLKCRVCTKHKITKQTCYRCRGCVGNPPLCPSCFQEWHTDPMFTQ